MVKPSPTPEEEITELDKANLKGLLARVLIAKMKKARADAGKKDLFSDLSDSNTPMEKKEKLPKTISSIDIQIAKMFAEGLTTINVAENMGITPRTVENRIFLLRQKTNTKTKIHLIAYLLKNQLI